MRYLYCTQEEWNEYHRLLRLSRQETKSCRTRYIPSPFELSMYHMLRRLAFPDIVRAPILRHYRKNKNRYSEWGKQFRRNNPSYQSERAAKDLNYRITLRLRERLRAALRRSQKSDATMNLLGCTIESFKLYLESKFEQGMSWENYGRGEGTWQIDHIMPCAIFDLTDPYHQRRCFHFSNMQPMWTHINQSKGCKVSYA